MQAAIAYLRQQKGPGQDHIIVTEHHTTRIFQQLSTLEITEEDHDDTTSTSISKLLGLTDNNPFQDLEKPLTIPRKVQEFCNHIQDNHKRGLKDFSTDKFMTEPIENPFPSYLRPKEYMLTAKAIKRTHDCSAGKKVIPSGYTQLGGKGKFSTLDQVDDEIEEERKVDEDEALNLKFSLSHKQERDLRALLRDRTNKITPLMNHWKESIKDHPLLREWQEAAEELQDLVQVVPEPMFPLSSYQMYNDVPARPARGGNMTVWEDGQDELRGVSGWADDDIGYEAYSVENLEEFNGDIQPTTIQKNAQPLSSGNTNGEDYEDDTPHWPRYQYQSEADSPRDDILMMEASTYAPHNELEHFDVEDSRHAFGPTPISSPTSGHIQASWSPHHNDAYVNYDLLDDPTPIQEDRPQWNESTETIFKEWLDPATFQTPSPSLQVQMKNANKAYQPMSHAHSQNIAQNQWDGEMSKPRQPARDRAATMTVESSGSVGSFSNDHYPAPQHFTQIEVDGVEGMLANRGDWDAAPKVRMVYNDYQYDTPFWETSSDAPRTIVPGLINPSQPIVGLNTSFEDEGHPASPIRPSRPRWATRPPSRVNDHPVAHGTESSQPFTSARTPDQSSQLAPAPVISHKQSIPSSTSGDQHRSTKKLTATNHPSLKDIVLAHKTTRENTDKKGKKKASTSGSSKTPAAPNMFSLDGYLALHQRNDLISKSEKNHHESKYDEVDKRLEEEEKTQWMSDPCINNPRWYNNATEHPIVSPQEGTFPILVAMTIFQNLSLFRALRSAGFLLLERENKMHSVDIVLSSTTAVLFQDLAKLSYGYEQLLKDVKDSCTKFKKVIVIFETISFAKSEKDPEFKKKINPLTTDAPQGLATFRRLLPVALKSVRETIGNVEMVFAYDGASQVAKNLMWLMDEEGKKVLKKDKKGYQDVFGDRKWLEDEPDERELELLMTHFGLNIFCAWYATSRYGTAQRVITGMDDVERKKAFEHVFGETAVERFNEDIAKKGMVFRSGK
ncbi:hypothetical protein L486_07606 [Kwoniella mangroviensis CBS 10435]|uniref:Uncharacterized protein n=1 Tax=Kwoniella mangroviensis CBS 10435 TaxID=1331196 RepID=A0A1B9IHU2_9TREE|nr:hypothetical protein L486_07606 [Kwoniella mangroviensis CBS 10435]